MRSAKHKTKSKKPTKKSKKKSSHAGHADACTEPLDDDHLDRGECCPTGEDLSRSAKKKIDTNRAEAAAEVLQAVFLHKKNFDLESEIVREGGHPIAQEDAEGHLWIIVRLHVPALDVETWLDGSHLDHPNNQPDDDEDDA